MRVADTNPQAPHDPDILALMALGWILSDEDRAHRLLALTGLDAGDLRAQVGEPVQQAAILDFLCAHEPDLVACAEALGVPAATLSAAQAELNGAPL